jgi:hypothetical protein
MPPRGPPVSSALPLPPHSGELPAKPPCPTSDTYIFEAHRVDLVAGWSLERRRQPRQGRALLDVVLGRPSGLGNLRARQRSRSSWAVELDSARAPG